MTCKVLGLVVNTAYTFTVAAHNAAGLGVYSARSNQATFPLIAAPSITYAPNANETVTAGTAITTATITNTGGPIASTSYSTNMSGSLPSGLSFDPITGTISGTPAVGTQTTVPFTLTYTAQNQNNTSNAVFKLTILPAPASKPIIAFSPNTGSVIAGSQMTSVTPNWDATSGAINANQFALTATVLGVSTTVPTWVNFDTSNGLIGGTPPSGTANGTIVFTVTATGPGGTGSATYALSIIGVPVISYASSPLTIAHGSSVTATATNSGGATTSFSCTVVSPTGKTCANVTAGVVFNQTDGSFTITTASTLAAQSDSFTVTATNSAGTSEPASFQLTITDSTVGGGNTPAPTPNAGALIFVNNVNAALPAGTAVTLNATSTTTGAISYSVTGANCQLTRNILVATEAGATCVVTATQPVPGSAALSQQASFTFGLQAQAPLRINNKVRTTKHGLGISISTSGGSGMGAVTYQVVPGGSGTACRITTDGSGVTSPTAVTTCNVTATKAANGVFDAVTSSVVTFTFQ